MSKTLNEAKMSSLKDKLNAQEEGEEKPEKIEKKKQKKLGKRSK